MLTNALDEKVIYLQVLQGSLCSQWPTLEYRPWIVASRTAGWVCVHASLRTHH